MQKQRKWRPQANPLVQIFHLGVAGEQAKRAAFTQFQQPQNFIRGLGRKSRVAHVGHPLRQIEKRLLAIVKLRWQRALFRIVQPQALPNVVEAIAHR